MVGSGRDGDFQRHLFGLTIERWFWSSEKPRRDYSTHFFHLKCTLKKSETNEPTKLFCILQEKCVASWQLWGVKAWTHCAPHGHVSCEVPYPLESRCRINAEHEDFHGIFHCHWFLDVIIANCQRITNFVALMPNTGSSLPDPTSSCWSLEIQPLLAGRSCIAWSRSFAGVPCLKGGLTFHGAYLAKAKISNSSLAGVHYLVKDEPSGLFNDQHESKIGASHQWGSLQDVVLGKAKFSQVFAQVAERSCCFPACFQILLIQIWTLTLSLAKIVDGQMFFL